MKVSAKYKNASESLIVIYESDSHANYLHLVGEPETLQPVTSLLEGPYPLFSFSEHLRGGSLV